MPKAKYATNADGYKRRQITYRDATGATRTKRLTAKTDKELDDKIAAFYKSIGNGLALVNQKTTFGEYMDLYIDTNAPRWAPSTLYSVKCSAWHVRNKIGAAPLFAITSSMLMAIFSDASPRYRSLVRCVFRSAVKDGLLLRDPSLCLVQPKLKSSTLHRCLTREQIAAVTSAALHHDNCLFILLMLYAGLRVMQAVYVDVDRDVDFAAGTLTVRGAYATSAGYLIPSTTKTPAGMRTIPLMPQLLSALKGKHGPAFVFSHTPITRAQVNTVLYHMICWSGVEFHAHDFRHTYCSLLWEAGVDLKTAQLWMGHSTSGITLDIYTHLSAAHQSETSAKAAAFFSSL